MITTFNLLLFSKNLNLFKLFMSLELARELEHRPEPTRAPTRANARSGSVQARAGSLGLKKYLFLGPGHKFWARCRLGALERSPSTIWYM